MFEDDGDVSRGVHRSDQVDWYVPGDVLEHGGRVLRVFRIEASDPPHAQRLLCDIGDAGSVAKAPSDEPPKARETSIDVAPRAADQIRSSGGKLYLWQEPFGRAWLVDKASFEWPRGLHFRTFKVAGVEIHIASDVEPPELLSITRSVLTRLKLHIEWDGKLWGARGEGPKPDSA